MANFGELESGDRSIDLVSPNPKDLIIIKDAIMRAADQPRSVVQVVDDRLKVQHERVFLSGEGTARYIFAVMFRAIMHQPNYGGLKIVTQFKERTTWLELKDASTTVSHNYRLERLKGGRIIEGRQSVTCTPLGLQVAPVTDEAATLQEYLEAEKGLTILQEELGTPEHPSVLTSGDCGVLRDRIDQHLAVR